MEKELLNSDKKLLLKDLCARLPYGVKIQTSFGKIDEPIELKSINIGNGTFSIGGEYATISGISLDTYECKPYLIPLSSMTEEQNKELHDKLIELELKALNDEISRIEAVSFEIDYYLKNHFDYRGLIEKGLAIDATGLNIYKEDVK